jgi:hypothetical protein
MGWLTRGHRRYYYHPRRVGGKVTNEYIGTGERAESYERSVTAASARRRQQREEAATEDRELDALADLADDLVTATLIAKGYHTHHRQWRRIRGQRDNDGD